jgi:hypothetical protein
MALASSLLPERRSSATFFRNVRLLVFLLSQSRQARWISSSSVYQTPLFPCLKKRKTLSMNHPRALCSGALRYSREVRDGGKPDVELPHSHALFPFFQGTEDDQPHLSLPDRDEVDLGCCWGLHLPGAARPAPEL